MASCPAGEKRGVIMIINDLANDFLCMAQRKNVKMASCVAGEKRGGSRTVALTGG